MSVGELRVQIRHGHLYRSVDSAEADAAAPVLDWIASGAPLFRERGPVPGRHLAAYFALLDPSRGTVLQLHHIRAGETPAS
jgi:hypothetical protein